MTCTIGAIVTRQERNNSNSIHTQETFPAKMDNDVQRPRTIRSEIQTTCDRQQLQACPHHGGEDANHQVVLE